MNRLPTPRNSSAGRLPRAIRAWARASALAGAALIATAAFATTGAPDVRFGTGGRVLTPITSGGGFLRAVATQTDGKFVAVGERYIAGAQDFLVARFSANGVLDTSFGTAGLAFADSNGNAPAVDDDLATAVAILPDGRIVVAGTGLGQVVVMRFSSAGALDTTFGTGGIVRYPAFPESAVVGVIVQPDGRIVVGAGLRNATEDLRTFGLLRFLANGNLDPDFGCGTPGTCSGRVSAPFAANDQVIRGIARQPGDGRIVAVGEVLVDTGTGSRNDFAFARYDTNGLFDATFGSAGTFTGTLATSDSSATTLKSLIVLAGGEIVAGGDVTDGVAGTLRMAAVRITPTGGLDATFGSGGAAIVTNVTLSSASALVRQSDGKLVLAGFGGDGITVGAALYRMQANGAPDPGFGTGGLVVLAGSPIEEWIAAIARADDRLVVAGRRFDTMGTTAILHAFTAGGATDATFGTGGVSPVVAGASADVINRIALLADGRILAGGQVLTVGTLAGVLARYTPAGALDPTFGTGGLANHTGAVRALAVAPDGRIVTGASSNSRFTVSRFTADGTPDTSFGGVGRVTTVVNGTLGHELTSILVQPDGKIVAGGTARSGSGASTQRFTLVRYNVDGTLDASFGASGRLMVAVGSGPSRVRALALLAGGKIVAAGNAEDAAGTRMTLVRLSASGTVETAYFDALVATNVSAVETMRVDASGRYVMVGAETVGSNGVALRVNADFTADASFGGTGIVVPSGGNVRDVAFQPDGKLVFQGFESLTRVSEAGIPDTTFNNPFSVLDLTAALGVAVDARQVAIDAQGQIIVAGNGNTGGGTGTDLMVARLDSTDNAHPFAFAAQTGVARGVVVTSAPAAITGLPAPTLATVTNGEFCVSSASGCACNVRAFAGGNGNVATGQFVCVRHTASASYLTTVTTSLAIGPVNASFSSTTLGAAVIGISAPSAFPAQAVGTTSAGQVITVSNTGALPASSLQVLVSGGDFGISTTTCGTTLAAGANCTVTVVFAPVQAGGRIGELVVLSTNSDDGDVRATLTGTGTAADTTPDAFSFSAVTGVAPASVQTSATATITGISAPAAISVTGGTYAIGCGATFTAAAGTIANGQTVCVRHTASASYGASVTTTLTVGGVAAGFVSTTAAATSIPRLANISTRMQVLTGNDVLIGGFVIGGSQPKTVVVRARGPSLIPFGIPNALANPTMQLFSGQTVLETSDDWVTAANAADITASGFAPSSPLESAILRTLVPGPYTAVVSGVGGLTGVGIIEVFEVDKPEVPLLNISTRGQVLTGGDVMIGGFIIQGDSPQTVTVRARGPSLVSFGITNALLDPVLQLFNGATLVASNDDWQVQTVPGDVAAIQASGFAVADPREAVIRITLPPGAYTAIVSGKGGTTGVGIIEAFVPGIVEGFVE